MVSHKGLTRGGAYSRRHVLVEAQLRRLPSEALTILQSHPYLQPECQGSCSFRAWRALVLGPALGVPVIQADRTAAATGTKKKTWYAANFANQLEIPITTIGLPVENEQ